MSGNGGWQSWPPVSFLRQDETGSPKKKGTGTVPRSPVAKVGLDEFRPQCFHDALGADFQKDMPLLDRRLFRR